MLETNYQYRRNKEYDKTVSTGAHTRLRCFSKKTFKKLNRQNSYTIVGSIGTGMSDPIGQYTYGTENGFYYASKQSVFKYRTLGYIEVGENQYFAVMKKSKSLQALPLFLLVLIGILALFFFMKNANSLIDKSAVDYTPPEELNIEGSENSIILPGFRQIYMEAGTSDANVVLWNPTGNPCYFKYILKQEDEILFESGLVPPGKAVTEVELSKTIPQGEHDLTIEIKTFSLEDKETPLNGGTIQCKLIGIKP